MNAMMPRGVRSLAVFLTSIFVAPAASAHFLPATISISPDAVVIANGFVSTRFSLSSPALDTLVACEARLRGMGEATEEAEAQGDAAAAGRPVDGQARAELADADHFAP